MNMPTNSSSSASNIKLNRRQFLAASAGVASFSSCQSSMKMDSHLLQNLSVKNSALSFNQLHNESFSPQLVLRPSHQREIAPALSFCNDNKLALGLRSGGHDFEGRCLRGKAVLDLSGLKRQQLDGDLLRVEAGVTLGEVYDFLGKKGRLLPAGSCSGVGLAGLTLGGGYGFFSRAHGLTCDHLLSAEVHSLNRSQFSADEHLLRLLRGGGHSLGVISEMRFVTQEMPPKLHLLRLRMACPQADDFEQILRKWTSWAANLPRDCFSSLVLNRKRCTLITTCFNSEPSEIAADMNKNFSQGKPSSQTSFEMPGALKKFSGAKGPLRFRNFSAGMFSSLDEYGSSTLRQLISLMQQTPGGILQFTAFAGSGMTRPKNDSVFAHRDKLFIAEAQCYWERPSQTNSRLESMNLVSKLISDSSIEAHYANYPDLSLARNKQRWFGKAVNEISAARAHYGKGLI